MKKAEQKKINEKCLEAIEEFNKSDAIPLSKQRLRTCTAEVIKTVDYIYLRSYNTIIAFIDLNTDEFYDVLRYVYGYTSTSARHIAKFRNDYKNYWFDYYTYYNV